jgi:hypothetical protein
LSSKIGHRVALNYYTPSRHSDHPEHGKISRYAWGRTITEFSRNGLPPCQLDRRAGAATHGLYYSDTGPMMDKAWAIRAVGVDRKAFQLDYSPWVVGFSRRDSSQPGARVRCRSKNCCGTVTAVSIRPPRRLWHLMSSTPVSASRTDHRTSRRHSEELRLSSAHASLL